MMIFLTFFDLNVHLDAEAQSRALYNAAFVGDVEAALDAILHGGDVAWGNPEEGIATPSHQVTGNDMITFITDVLPIFRGILNYILPVLLPLGRYWRESIIVGAPVPEWGASGCRKRCRRGST